MQNKIDDKPGEHAVDRFNRQAMPLLPALYRTALMLTHHEQEAEDLVQETMLRAYRRIETFEPGTRMKPWLMTILRRLHIDTYRRVQARVGADSLDAIGIDPVAPDTPDRVWDEGDPNSLLEKIDDQSIEKELRELPEPMRWVLLLVDVEQFSISEAASILGVPEGTVKSRASRARIALRQRLEPIARERGWVA